MKKNVLCAFAALAVTVSLVGCSNSSPTSASHTLTIPKAVSPATGSTFKFTEQPLTLVVDNAVTTGKGALTYSFEIATDEAFNAKVWTKEAVPAGTSQTSVKLDTTLAGGKGYYWRARANDGGTPGPYANGVNFNIGPAIDLQAPQPIAPASGETVAGTKPTFTIANALRSGPVGTIFYRFEVGENREFTPLTAAGTVQEDPSGRTSWTPDNDLPTDKTLYWRVRTTDPANNVTSSFSNVRNFTAAQGIDLNTVIYVKGPNIAKWPQSSTITAVEQGDGWLCIYHTMLGVWPNTQYMDTDVRVEGNQWIFAFINGKWYGGSISRVL